MIRLALDTSSVACSVALKSDDVLIERHEMKPREHTRLLMPMIRAVLNEANIELRSLDAIVLGNGPGSFIGMRIAASVAQGIAHGSGLKIIPVSSLAAIAAEVFATTNADIAAVTQDAHMEQTYLGLYEHDETGMPIRICAERLQNASIIKELSTYPRHSIATAGLGWQRYPELKEANSSLVDFAASVVVPRAAYLLRISSTADAIEPTLVQPTYLRQKVASKPAGTEP